MAVNWQPEPASQELDGHPQSPFFQVSYCQNGCDLKPFLPPFFFGFMAVQLILARIAVRKNQKSPSSATNYIALQCPTLDQCLPAFERTNLAKCLPKKMCLVFKKSGITIEVEEKKLKLGIFCPCFLM